jgi:hypothetical protein
MFKVCVSSHQLLQDLNASIIGNDTLSNDAQGTRIQIRQKQAFSSILLCFDHSKS